MHFQPGLGLADFADDLWPHWLSAGHSREAALSLRVVLGTLLYYVFSLYDSSSIREARLLVQLSRVPNPKRTSLDVQTFVVLQAALRLLRPHRPILSRPH